MVFKMNPEGTATMLHSFEGTDGMTPYAALVQAANGVLCRRSGRRARLFIGHLLDKVNAFGPQAALRS